MFKISLSRTMPSVGSLVTATGWGWTVHDKSSVATVLQYLSLPIAADSYCNKEDLNLTKHEFCVGKSTGKYMNVCHGDSGTFNDQKF